MAKKTSISFTCHSSNLTENYKFLHKQELRRHRESIFSTSAQGHCLTRTGSKRVNRTCVPWFKQSAPSMGRQCLNARSFGMFPESVRTLCSALPGCVIAFKKTQHNSSSGLHNTTLTLVRSSKSIAPGRDILELLPENAQSLLRLCSRRSPEKKKKACENVFQIHLTKKRASAHL